MASSQSTHFFHRLGRWLLSPWMILGSMGIGIFLGAKHAQLASFLAPIGDVYLSLLKMCVIPIMVSAIISSISNLLSSGMTGRILIRILLVFGCGLLLAAAIGLGSGAIGQPGQNLPQQSKKVLGQLIQSSQSSTGHSFAPDMKIHLNPKEQGQDRPVLSFVQEVIPENIFAALSQGQNLQILIFSLALGIALSFINKDLRQHLSGDLEAVFQAFVLIIGWLMYLLPVGLCFLIASQVEALGLQVLGAMMKYILWIYAACVILACINTLVLAFSTQQGILNSFRFLKKPLLIAFFTRYSYAAMPSAIEVLKEKFGISANTVNFIIPLGITMCRFGTVTVFALSTIFLAQLFSIPLHWYDWGTILGGSVLAGIASAGTPGVVALSMISIVLTPLGLPLEVALVLLLAVDPITDPVLTFVNVHSNCAACSLIQGSSQERAPVSV